MDRIPIIALSASAFEEDREKVLSAGCDGFVRKPFLEEDIFEKVAQHLGVRYVYSEMTATIEKEVEVPGFVVADLTRLSVKWIEALHQAASEGRAEQIIELINQIPSDLSRLAPTLTELVENDRYMQIVDLIEKAQSIDDIKGKQNEGNQPRRNQR